MEIVDSNSLDKLSNLKIVLISIERAEVSVIPETFEIRRGELLGTIQRFFASRCRLGICLAKYRHEFKQEQVWLLARKAIAKCLDCSPETISRIIKAAEPAGDLDEFTLRAAEEKGLDLGRKKHAPVLNDLLRMPRAKSKPEGEATVSETVAKHARRSEPAPETPETVSIPTEKFGRRMVKLSMGYLETLPVPSRALALRYIFELIAAAAQIDVPPLRRYQRMSEVPQPQPGAVAKGPTAA